ncbi:hypothetical protein SAMN05444166_0183 [Singulisphaera sp. GP187]|uniref:hypothetical protein n=1 Tax=Singulisphaera sp. GP187 TaxID=1882752 RepID=UPI00092BC3A8|nr:hypothetical protein [Singulisphaera sp. GP187]SIN69521.1 hypothetical protein SAMN05444166_0183 [Singulisphaera sp. GP187]
MAKTGGNSGDWLLIQELFERGEPAFVDALRAFDDAEVLGAFAPRWLADRRPEARSLLFSYLDRPLNAYRHEALVKRLFKLAEAAGDDALMARFLVALDRSIRRTMGKQVHFESEEVSDEPTANALAASWRDRGFESVNVWRNWRQRYQVSGRWSEPCLVAPRNTTMPRGALKETYDLYSWNAQLGRYQTFSVPDWVFALKLEPRQFRQGESFPEERRKDLARYRLFSVTTRHYLRRRAWRYFRRLGRNAPQRYLPAVTEALLQYRDADVDNGLALIDNWGLIHILFRFSPVLVPNERGWRVAPGRSLAELEPAPRYKALWGANPRVFVDLLIEGRCRPVRGWAIRTIRRNPTAILAVFPLEERLALLEDDDPEVVGLAADLIRDDPGLAAVPVSRWLALVETASPAALDILCGLIERLVTPDRVTLAEAVRLAVARPLPVARLGLEWLRTKDPRDEAECLTLLGLLEAGADPLRGEILAWLRPTLASSPWLQPDWILQWLDSRHEDVRAEGWRWLESNAQVRDDVATWQRLLESPYDDIRLALIAALDERSRQLDAFHLRPGKLDPDLLRLLWASVLLNIHRGSRAKPKVVQQLLRRAEDHPADLPRLLPLLAVALRSVRGPEWRAGLSAVVRLAERDEASATLVGLAFPELQFQTAGPGPSRHQAKESR